MIDIESSPPAENEIGRRARLYRARAIVLRRRDIGETDRILTILTDIHGRQKVIAKGVRRPGSRMAGHLEPFSVSNILVARTRGLDILSQAEVVDSFGALRSNEAAIATAGYFAELVDTLTAEAQQHDGIFELVHASLNLLDSGRDRRLVTCVFEMGLLRLLGYRPRLDPCLFCGSTLNPERNGFHIDGGAICGRCLTSRPDAYPLGENALKLLRMIDRGEIERALHLRVSPDVLGEVDAALTAYVARISGRESGSLRVIRELRLE